MNYLTLDLPNGDLVLSDNSVWKSLNIWLNGGTLYSDYYDASNSGDYWKASEHWINIDSSSTYLSFTIEYDFVNASATDSCLCQIKYDGTSYGIAVTADPTGLNIRSVATIKHVYCNYSNANIKIDIVANLLTKVITTYIHKNGIPLIKVVNDSSSYTFTEFVIQAGAFEADTYKLLPTTTKLLNVSVSDDDITYSDFTDVINYVDKFGVAEIWANIKNYITTQLLGKSNTGHTHVKSEITDFPTIPTKTSDLTNDSGFLTSHQDLSGYIPLSGTTALSGSIIPSTDNSYNLGNSSYTYKTIYTHNLNLAMSNAIERNVNNEELNLYGGVDYFGGAVFQLKGKDVDSYQGCFVIRAYDGSVETSLIGDPRGYLTWGSKNVAMAEDFVPRSGGAVMTGDLLASSTINSIGFGYGWGKGGTIYTYSPTHSTVEWQGSVRLEPLKTTSNFKTMQLKPDGTWTWSGTACQITSDQRLKQQITEIDDKLLDAWEDVELSQFKYNDAVSEKGTKARLHTGFVVQQIDSACKSHGVDVSAYGLYCHEVYPEETEEIEVEQKDGTKTKEKKVIREASEHYSLRYTEALIVECKYLRRCVERLTGRIEQLEKGNNSK